MGFHCVVVGGKVHRQLVSHRLLVGRRLALGVRHLLHQRVRHAHKRVVGVLQVRLLGGENWIAGNRICGGRAVACLLGDSRVF